MRVGLLTSYRPHEMRVAWATLPLMHRYCHIRGYTLAVGIGMSADGMFERFGDQFETAMLFVPVWFVVLDPSVQLAYNAPPSTTPPPGLGMTAETLENVRLLARCAA